MMSADLTSDSALNGTTPMTATVRILNVRLLVGTLVLLTCGSLAAMVLHRYQIQRTASALLDRSEALKQVHSYWLAADYIHRYLQLRPNDDRAIVQLARTYDLAAKNPNTKSRAIELYYRAIGVAAASDQPDIQAWVPGLRCRLAELLLDRGQDDINSLPPAIEQASFLPAQEPDEDVSAIGWRVLALARYQLFRMKTVYEPTFDEAWRPECIGRAAHGMPLASIFQRALQWDPSNVPLSMILAHDIYRKPKIAAILSDSAKSPPAELDRMADSLIDTMVASAREDLAKCLDSPPRGITLPAPTESAGSDPDAEKKGAILRDLLTEAQRQLAATPDEKPTDEKPTDEKARTQWAEQLERHNEHYVLTLLARCAYRIEYGLPGEQDDLALALAHGPEELVARVLAAQEDQRHARLAAQEGNTESALAYYRDAMHHYQKAVQVDPEQEQIQLALGAVYLTRPELAVQEGSGIVNELPDQGVLRGDGPLEILVPGFDNDLILKPTRPRAPSAWTTVRMIQTRARGDQAIVSYDAPRETLSIDIDLGRTRAQTIVRAFAECPEFSAAINNRLDHTLATWYAAKRQIPHATIDIDVRLAETLLESGHQEQADEVIAELDANVESLLYQISVAERNALRRKTDILRARSALARGEHTRAIMLLETLVAAEQSHLDQEDVSTRRLLGEAYAAVEDWQQAALQFERAASNSPASYDLRVAAANCWIHQSDVRRALGQYERALNIAQRPEVVVSLAQCYLQMQREVPIQARDWASFRQTVGRLDQACWQSLFARLLDNGPIESSLAALLAETWSPTAREESAHPPALSPTRSTRGIIPQAPTVRTVSAADAAQLCDMLAGALVEEMPAQALSLLQQATRLGPDEPLYHLHLAACQDRAGNQAQAHVAYTKARELGVDGVSLQPPDQGLLVELRRLTGSSDSLR
jgi:tetratricopeptide (TPR) repeat protein